MAELDWQKIGRMLEADCTAVGIADEFGVSVATLYKRCLRDNKIDFSAFSQQKKMKGNDLLRVKQYQSAMAGNVVMMIWLGKQRLGQSDKSEVSGKDGGDIVIRINGNLPD
jgi:hypothetical protein